MKKQLMLLLGILSLLIPAGLVFSGSASADHEEPCVPNDAVAAFYGPWTNEGDVIRTEENVPPGADTDTVRYVPGSPATVDDSTTTVEFDYWQRYSLVGGSWPEGPTPAFPDPGEPFRWQANVQGDPHGIGVEGAYSVSNEQSGNTDWFYLEAVTKTVIMEDTDYLWQKQVRTFTPAVPAHECDDDQEPLVCPDDSEINAGEVIPEGQTAEEFCSIDTQGEQTCPTDSEINAGEEIPPGQTAKEFCNRDNPPRNPPNPPNPQGEQETPPEVAGKQQHVPMRPAPAVVPTAVDAGL